MNYRYRAEKAVVFFSVWKEITLKRKFLELKRVHNNLKIVDGVFKRWRQNIELSRRIKPFQAVQRVRAIAKGFIGLKRYAGMQFKKQWR
jgi:hypothetical protein